MFIFQIIIFSLLIVNISAANEKTAAEALTKAKTYVFGKNLGLVAMEYVNIGSVDANEIGFESIEIYRDTGNDSVVIRALLKNISKSIIAVNPIHFKITTEQGYTLPLSKYTYTTKRPFPVTNLEPNTKIEGFVVFEKNSKDSPVKIIYDDNRGNRVERSYIDCMVLGFDRDVKKMKSGYIP
jgi:hypothetical protein